MDITIPPEDEMLYKPDLTENRTVDVLCLFDGAPTPDITWLLDGRVSRITIMYPSKNILVHVDQPTSVAIRYFDWYTSLPQLIGRITDLNTCCISGN